MTNKAQITMQALRQRLKRHYARLGAEFHSTRGGACGEWYLTKGPELLGRWTSIESLVAHARDAGALKPYEELAS